MVIKGQLIERTVCFSEQQACDELIYSFIRQKPNNIMLRQQTVFFYEPKVSSYDTYTSQLTILLFDLQVWPWPVPNYFEIHV